MPRTSQRAAAAAAAAAQAVVAHAPAEVAEEIVTPIEDVGEDVNGVAESQEEDFFSQFMEEENEVLTKEDIIRNLLASGQCKL